MARLRRSGLSMDPEEVGDVTDEGAGTKQHHHLSGITGITALRALRTQMDNGCNCWECLGVWLTPTGTREVQERRSLS